MIVLRRFATDGTDGVGRPGTAGAAPEGGFGAEPVGGFGAEGAGSESDAYDELGFAVKGVSNAEELARLASEKVTYHRCRHLPLVFLVWESLRQRALLIGEPHPHCRWGYAPCSLGRCYSLPGRGRGAPARQAAWEPTPGPVVPHRWEDPLHLQRASLPRVLSGRS